MNQSVIDTLVDAMRLRIEKEVLVLEAKFNDKFSTLTNLVSETVKSGSEIEGRVKALIPEPVVIPDFAAQIEALKSIIPTVDLIVDEIDASLQKKSDELEAKFAAKMPVVPDVAEIVKSAVGAMTSAQPIVQTVEPVLPDVQKMIDDSLELRNFPTLQAVEAQIAEAIGAIPALPSVELPDFNQIVSTAIAALPVAANGNDGVDGKDAAEIEVAPAIRDGKSYTRGTYASHNGGLWRASRETDPIEKGDAASAGWHCLVKGIAEVRAMQVDDGVIAIKTIFSDGKDSIERVDLGGIYYKGVYEKDAEYSKNAAVTWGGSLWTANKKTNALPGASDDWTLTAKRGRDAKAPVKIDT